MTDSDTDLHDFLLDFRNPSPDEDTFQPDLMNEVERGLSEFLSILGYENDGLIHGITIETPREEDNPEPFTFDVVAARSANAPPYLAIATILTDDNKREEWERRLVYDLFRADEAIDSHYTAFFQILVFISGNQTTILVYSGFLT